MIGVVHYTDEHLIAMLEAGDEEAITRNQHLSSCETCRASLDEYRSIVQVLGDKAAWDFRDLKDEPDPTTVANLRAFATSMAREDEDAERYVAALLEGARETWMPRLRAHPEWRTAGVVRKLASLSYPTLDKMPPDAVEITNLAVEIADHIDPAKYPRDTASRVRGTAWRERAYALFYVGKFHESLTACDRADAAFAECVVDEYDRARVAVIRALSLRPLDRVVEGSSLARGAIHVFAIYGDDDRKTSAALATAQMLAKTSDYHAALKILLPITEYAERFAAHTRVTLESNIAYCYRHVGQYELSIRHYEACSAILSEIGSVSESVRVRWNVANLLASTGRTSDALRELSDVRSELDRLGMESEVCLSALELAELLLVEGRAVEAESLCRETCARLATSGLSTGSRALTAVAYLHEAMRVRSATVKLVRHVRDYVRRLPEEPNLLFAPPSL